MYTEIHLVLFLLAVLLAIRLGMKVAVADLSKKLYGLREDSAETLLLRRLAGVYFSHKVIFAITTLMIFVTCLYESVQIFGEMAHESAVQAFVVESLFLFFICLSSAIMHMFSFLAILWINKWLNQKNG